MNNNPFSKFFAFIGSFIAAILGRFSWNSPPWIHYFRNKAAARPRLFWGITIGIIAFFVLATYGYHWYTNLPRPQLVTAQIKAPHTTPLEKVLVPDTVIVAFGINKYGFTAQSVAPLNMIGKEVTKGITLSPAFPGKWVWQDDNSLLFTPSQDWPAGQEYSIDFDKSVFSAKTKMESLSYTFTTKPFQISIDEFKLYQDPINPKLRNTVATIHFNYPVDSESFESNTTLLLQAIKNDKLNLNAERFKYTVTYDEHKRTAYMHSENIPLSQVARYLELIIDKGVKPLSGTKTKEVETKDVLIPDLESYFKVDAVSANIVRNDQDKPEQVISVETSLGVKESEINKSIHVFLLPANYPATDTQEEKINYEWKNPGEVTPEILKVATPLDTQAIPADRDFAYLHSYKFKAPASRFIYLKIDKGMQSFGDFALTNDYAAVIKVPEFPKEISFLHPGALIALGGEKKLSVIARGVPAVQFQMARILPDDINHLITQTEGKFNHPHFINTSFNQNNISEIFSEIQQFDTTDMGKEQYTALDLGKYLAPKTNGEGPHGLFLLHATGWDNTKNIALDVKADRLILITDLGLLVKDNADHSHDVFVQSITQGTPVAQATVSILGKNGILILTRTTDAKGQAHFPTLDDFKDEREPTVYLAKLGDDIAFIPYNNSDRQLNYSRFDTGGVVNSDELQSLRGYLFSDRGIYRPGDTAHIGIIVKRAFAESQPAGLPLEIEVTDPRGNRIQDQKYTLDATGYSSFDFHTESTSLTGQYMINLFIVKDNHPRSFLGSTAIRVAEFQPDRMRITAHLSQEQPKGWISPKGLSANIQLMNLYGAPASNRKISGKILLTPKTVQFDDYSDYTFIDPLYDPNKPPKTYTDTLPDARTNDQGQAQFNLNLERFDKATYQLTFFAEGFESEGGRSVTTQVTTLVTPLAYLVGYKPDGDLNYINQNSQRSVNFIAINPQLKQQAVNNLKMQLASLRPVTTLVKNPNGTYQYQSIIQTKVISTQPFSVDATGTNFTLPSQEIGNFAIRILDQNDTELCQFKYNVVGAGQVPLPKNAELNVKLNKTEYKSDEDIEMQITAPYTGAGLITIERDNLYVSQWFKTNATSSIQKIHIPKDFQGNGYVNVAFVRDWNSPEIFMSPLSYSIIPFTVNNDNHSINIDLETPEVARPGEPFTISYKSDKPGKIIVFAVDEGILQVAKYDTPDPLAYFFEKRALQVITQQTVDQILPKFIQDRELSAVGGDGSEEEIRSNLNPFKRKTELPVVYWSGIVDTDTTSRQLVYNIPDYFNGKLRVMAVAVAADSVGATEKMADVRGNFVINPNTPTFVAPGDEFEISASIANNVKNSGENPKVNVQLTTSPLLEVVGSAQQSIAISEGHEQTVRFKLRAKSALGSADMVFVASLNGQSSKLTNTLSVRPAAAYETDVRSGSSTDATKSLPLDRALYPEYRKVEAVISSNPLILVYGLARYLENFPYGCTEQLVSGAFPLLALANQPWFTPNPRIVTDKIEERIRLISQRQMASGGFSYWPGLGDNTNNAFASVYAIHFLTEAKRLGYNVPTALLSSAIGYLKDLVTEDVSSLEEARIHAYAIYILTRNEIVTTNYLTHLQLYLEKDTKKAWQQDITSAYIAATYQLLKSYSNANQLIDYYKPLIKSVNGITDFYNSTIGDAQYLYLLARHFPDRLSQIGPKLVITLANALNEDAVNTVLSGYTSLALSAYAQFNQATQTPSFSITEIMSDKSQKPLVAQDKTFQKVNVDNQVKQIDFKNPDKQNYFYQLTQAGFDSNLSTKSISQGLEIYREYRDAKGNVITQAHLGDEIEVHIRLRTLTDLYMNNLVVVDLLPGGFDVVRESVKSDNMDYVDAREDRVIFFGNASPDAKEIVYRIKAVNAGKYIVPPVMASSMYDLKVRARGITGSFNILN